MGTAQQCYEVAVHAYEAVLGRVSVMERTIRADSSSLSELMPMRLVSKAAHLQWRVLLLPWTTFLYWLSCCASLLMRFLVLTGSPPPEFFSKAKVRFSHAFF